MPNASSPSPIEADIAIGHGWHAVRHNDAEGWFFGHFRQDGKSYSDADAGTRLLQQLLDSTDPSGVLAELDGHFAVLIRHADGALAAVDRARTTPLFFAEIDGTHIVTNRPAGLPERLGLTVSDMDPLMTGAFALSGFTLGATTLYPQIHELAPGEMVTFRAGEPPHRKRYSQYRPDRAIAEAWTGDVKAKLHDVSLGLIEQLIADADGRPIVLPLSGGLDSRLIVSGLSHLGYRNVHCYSYGQAGNLEAVIAEKIADHLGYPWKMIASDRKAIRAFGQTDMAQEYLTFADTLSSQQNTLELYYLNQLKQSGFVPDDAILVNGQSGDFIAGAHIPKGLTDPTSLHTGGWETLLAAYEAKHLGHWRRFRTPSRLNPIRAWLKEAAKELDPDLRPNSLPFLYESLEFETRQAKYVIAGQRIYEFLGHDWRLPLWDPDYMTFWERVSLAHKSGQSLYKEMLFDANWGGVWGSAYDRQYVITPAWMRPVRFACKVPFAPFNRKHWVDFERQYIAYWIDPICAYASEPYGKVAMDRRGFRSALSWHLETYLADKGLALDETGPQG